MPKVREDKTRQEKKERELNSTFQLATNRDLQPRILRVIYLTGPIMDATVRNTDDLKQLRALDTEKVSFVGEALKILRNELPNGAGGTALLGFVGSPWTLATYVVEVNFLLESLESLKSFQGRHFSGLTKSIFLYP